MGEYEDGDAQDALVSKWQHEINPDTGKNFTRIEWIAKARDGPPSSEGKPIAELVPSVEQEYYSSDDSGGSDVEDIKKRGNYFFKKNRFDKSVTYFTKAIGQHQALVKRLGAQKPS